MHESGSQPVCRFHITCIEWWPGRYLFSLVPAKRDGPVLEVGGGLRGSVHMRRVRCIGELFWIILQMALRFLGGGVRIEEWFSQARWFEYLEIWLDDAFPALPWLDPGWTSEDVSSSSFA